MVSDGFVEVIDGFVGIRGVDGIVDGDGDCLIGGVVCKLDELPPFMRKIDFRSLDR